MANGTPMDDDVQAALRVLEAIGVLQRWLREAPLGADALHLSCTTLTFTQGRDTVGSIVLPAA